MTVYLHGHHAAVVRSHSARTAENSAAYLLPHLRPGDTLLDVGCGPGTITRDLATRVAPGRVVGVDNAPEIIAAAPAAAGVSFDVADIHSLGHLGTFDVVHAHQVLQHLPDPVGALRELGRVARRLVAVRDADYGAFTWFPANPGLDEWLDLYRRVARHSGGEPDAGRRLLSWAGQAGFTAVAASASVWCYASPAEREFWGGTWAERVVESAFATRARELGLATSADLTRLAATWREWAAAPDGWFMVPHGEILISMSVN